MRFSTRAFLGSFLPFALLLAASFRLIEYSVLSTVRDGLRASLRETHTLVARVQSQSAMHSARLLRVLGENAALKAGLQLLATEPDSAAALRTLEDQLGELSETVGFDLLVAFDPHGQALGGVVRSGERWAPLDRDAITKGRPWPGGDGFVPIHWRTYHLVSVPVNLDDENIGRLSVGEPFNLSSFSTPMVLSRNGRIVQSSVPNVAPDELTTALRACESLAECEVPLGGTSYVSLPAESLPAGDGYQLRSFQDVDVAARPIQKVLTRVFLVAGAGAILAALILSAFSTRAIAEPLGVVVRRLRESESTHDLAEFSTLPSSIPEIRELMTGFNRAAASIRQGRDILSRAHFGFVSSLASALDARDPYTSGHSHRVSRMATETARVMRLPDDAVEVIRIGALLHDIGKIGVPDTILRKAGALTKEEFDLVKEHPGIGRRILEPVGGFDDYLPIVELHHENWDGTGYPHGLKGEDVPAGARIVHVVDAYDAMTSDRPYRPGMSHEKAVQLLREFSGTQFDGAAVAAFLNTSMEWKAQMDETLATSSIQGLSAALAAASAPVLPPVEQRL